MFIIDEIVKLCNVFKIIVLRVLNNYFYVLKEKRDMILEVINEFDYIFNYLVWNFRRNKI